MWHEYHGLAIAYRVDSLAPREWMLWVHRPHEDEAPDSTWSWRLSPLGENRTRLVTRMKQDYRWETPKLAAFNLVLMEFGDFAMERRMFKGIKHRAERLTPSGLRLVSTDRTLPVLSSRTTRSVARGRALRPHRR